MHVYERALIDMTLQSLGAAFILVGYWTMAKSVKWASLSLLVGCCYWAEWSLFIDPPAYIMAALEVVLGAMSARTFWINRRNK